MADNEQTTDMWSKSAGEWWANWLKMQSASMQAMSKGASLMTDSYAKMWSVASGQRVKAKEGATPDPRFKDEAWDGNPAYGAMRDAYLIWQKWALGLTDTWKGVNPDVHKRMEFWTSQITDALSPSNYMWTNPVALREGINTGGASLAKGMQNFVNDVSRGRLTQVPADAFTVGKDLAITPGKVVFKNDLIEIIQYTPTTEKVHEIPLLIMPPWLNKFYILDMRPDNSMAKWLVDNGQTVFMMSWRNPDGAMKDYTWDDYMTDGPLAALDEVQKITGAKSINMTGYCLGGILLQSTLSYLTAIGQEKRVNSATFFTTHQDFGDAGDVSVFISEPEVRFLEQLMDISGGYLDGRNMASTFNMLRSNDLIWSYVVNNYLLGKQPPALDLLYWNSDGTRVPKTCHLHLLRNYFLKPNFSKPGYKLKGVPSNIHEIKTDTYTVAANTDHIVPWRGAFHMREMVQSNVRFVLAESGHIAGVVNHPAAKKRGYWTNDNPTTNPDEWFTSSARTAGSWWPDWLAWLEKRGGKMIAPPKMAEALYDAPGKYVLEK
ncbi:MAG: class I poly(R)-hydroxyalkanoic acid synthase [Anaerolineae bacterium]|nr:class I poly(R)-hydroxyalkanoic acid synthase [Thermoflexales bacterium]HQW35294.1 class I poly(R)-hydroxyalkanoic acid synthase [Thermoflexales bacterium]